MNTISVKWGVNQESGYQNIELEEVSCETMDEWIELPEAEKQERLQKALDEIPSPCYPMVESWD